MDQMLGLLPPKHEPCFIFRCLFIRQLPSDIRAQLVTASDKTPRELAIFACIPLPTSYPNPQPSNLFTALVSTPGAYRELLSDSPELLGSSFSELDPKHGVERHIQTTSPPVFSKPHRLNPTKLAIAKAELEIMEATGICRRSDSSWASPLHNKGMVPVTQCDVSNNYICYNL